MVQNLWTRGLLSYLSTGGGAGLLDAKPSAARYAPPSIQLLSAASSAVTLATTPSTRLGLFFSESGGSRVSQACVCPSCLRWRNMTPIDPVTLEYLTPPSKAAWGVLPTSGVGTPGTWQPLYRLERIAPLDGFKPIHSDGPTVVGMATAARACFTLPRSILVRSADQAAEVRELRPSCSGNSDSSTHRSNRFVGFVRSGHQLVGSSISTGWETIRTAIGLRRNLVEAVSRGGQLVHGLSCHADKLLSRDLKRKRVRFSDRLLIRRFLPTPTSSLSVDSDSSTRSLSGYMFKAMRRFRANPDDWMEASSRRRAHSDAMRSWTTPSLHINCFQGTTDKGPKQDQQEEEKEEQEEQEREEEEEGEEEKEEEGKEEEEEEEEEAGGVWYVESVYSLTVVSGVYFEELAPLLAGQPSLEVSGRHPLSSGVNSADEAEHARLALPGLEARQMFASRPAPWSEMRRSRGLDVGAIGAIDNCVRGLAGRLMRKADSEPEMRVAASVARLGLPDWLEVGLVDFYTSLGLDEESLAGSVQLTAALTAASVLVEDLALVQGGDARLQLEVGKPLPRFPSAGRYRLQAQSQEQANAQISTAGRRQ